MYLRFFGLTSEPFSIAPDPRFLFLSERHREALAHLRYGLGEGGGGFVVLTGEIGAGKTTVCRCMLRQVPANCHIAYLFNPRLTARELLQAVCQDFHIPAPREDPRVTSIKDYIDALNDFLLRAHAAGRHSVLIIDEAQQLSTAVLEQLRLLTNLETDERKLLQIVLIGQPELHRLLALPELEQLSQRVVARFHLGTLNQAESEHYVRHRMSVAGLTGRLPFDAAALQRIHHHARGVPRRINLLCDRALLGAYAEGTDRIGRSIVDKAAREVFGQRQAVGRRTRRAWAWGGAGLAAVLAAGLLTWTAWPDLGPASSPGADTAEAGTVAAVPIPGADRPGTRTDAAEAGTLAQGVAPDAAASAAAAAVVSSDAGPGAAAAGAEPLLVDDTQFAALLAEAPSDEASAWRALAQRWNAELPAQADPCSALRARAIHCYKRRGTLGLLQQLDRPAILPLYTQRGQVRFVVLDRLSADVASVRVGPRGLKVSPATLTVRWRDEFGILWRVPEGARLNAAGTPIAVDPQWLATRLAEAARVPARPVAELQGETRRSAIQAFQRAQGIEADGQLGTLTLMQLARVAGDDEPRLRE